MKAKSTQYARILDYLRRHHTATSWELSQAARSLSVHKRVDEMTDSFGWVCSHHPGPPGPAGWLRITREPIKIGGRNVTLYRLVRA